MQRLVSRDCQHGMLELTSYSCREFINRAAASGEINGNHVGFSGTGGHIIEGKGAAGEIVGSVTCQQGDSLQPTFQCSSIRGYINVKGSVPSCTGGHLHKGDGPLCRGGHIIKSHEATI